MIAMQKERMNRGWSQRELMRRSRVDAADLSKAENRGLKLYPSQLERIASALDWEGDKFDLLKEV